MFRPEKLESILEDGLFAPSSIIIIIIIIIRRRRCRISEIDPHPFLRQPFQEVSNVRRVGLGF